MKKMNNKGFSLVELIIVIAIMAVLIGVLAPQYMRYVEKSRATTDADAVGVVVTAVEAALADPNIYANATSPITVTVSTTGSVSVSGDTSDGDILAEINATVESFTFGSKKFKASNSTVTWTYEDATAKWTKTANGPYKSYVSY